MGSKEVKHGGEVTGCAGDVNVRASTTIFITKAKVEEGWGGSWGDKAEIVGGDEPGAEEGSSEEARGMVSKVWGL